MLYAINKLDVWHNRQEGYWINDILRDCKRVNINNPYNVREVLAAVRAAGYYLASGRYTTNINDFCSDDVFEIINRKSGEYVLQLEKIDE
jgi:predicted  nucleic acid-binding Zn-ribbon protein